MKFSELMNEFGREVGLAGITLDESGTCRFQVANTVLAFTGADDADRFMIWAEIGELPAEGRAELLRGLLVEMQPGGGLDGQTVFSVFPGSDTLALCRGMSLAGLELAQFFEATEAFIDLAEDWRHRLLDFTPPAGPASAKASSGFTNI